MPEFVHRTRMAPKRGRAKSFRDLSQWPSNRYPPKCTRRLWGITAQVWPVVGRPDRAHLVDRQTAPAVDYCGRLLLLTRSLIAPTLTLFKPAHIERFNRSVETFQSQLARRLKLEIAFD